MHVLASLLLDTDLAGYRADDCVSLKIKTLIS